MPGMQSELNFGSTDRNELLIAVLRFHGRGTQPPMPTVTIQLSPRPSLAKPSSLQLRREPSQLQMQRLSIRVQIPPNRTITQCLLPSSRSGPAQTDISALRLMWI